MSCPKCGGTVGPVSDLCLDCGHDPYVMTGFFEILFFALACIAVAVWAMSV